MSARISELVEAVHQETHIPGICVTVSAGGARTGVAVGTTTAGSGIPLTRSARFQIGCITKTFTALVALQLAHEGRLNMDAPIEEYLSEFRGTPVGQSVRVRHLGSHTSGYKGINPAKPEYGYFYSWSKFADFFRSAEQVFVPGSVFNYEHTESVLLGEIIRRVSGSSCSSLITELILDPLHVAVGSITGDGSIPDKRVADHIFNARQREFEPVRSAPYCGFWAASLSNMTLSTDDLATVGEALIGHMELPRLSAQALAVAHRQVISLPRMYGSKRQEIVPRSFGFGCAGYPRSLSGHNGSGRGQTSGLRFCPRRNLVIVVALNAWQPHVRDSLIESVMDIVGAPGDPCSETAQRSGRDLDVSSLEGRYAGCVDGVTVVVTRVGKEVHCAIFNVQGSTSKEVLKICLILDGSGELVPAMDPGHLSVGFFLEDDTGVPCIALGLNVFKRVS